MKKLLRYAAVAALGVSLAATTSCNKKDSDAVCHITSIVAGTTSAPVVYTLSYDAQGRLSKSVESGSSGVTTVFSYGTNTIDLTITKTTTGQLMNTVTLTLNAQGLIALRIERSPSGVQQSKTTYIYDSAGNLQTETYEYGSFTTTTNYNFTNGDMVRSTSGSNIVNYTYFSDKAWQNGDYWKELQYVYDGAYTVVNKHLMKSIINGSSTTDIVYEFDADGKIVKAVQSTNGAVFNTQNYTYTCN